MTEKDRPEQNSPDQLSQEILELIEAPRKLTTNRLWKTLTSDEQRIALESAVESTQYRDAMVGIVAEAHRSRKKTVAGWDNEKVVSALVNLSLPLPVPVWLFHGLWVGQSGPSRAFLDVMGVDNKDGMAENKTIEEAASEESVHAGMDRVRKTFDIRTAALFSLTLICQGSVFKDHLWQWMKNAVKINADVRNGIERRDETGNKDTGEGLVEPEGRHAASPAPGIVAEGVGETDEDNTDGGGGTEGNGGTEEAIDTETAAYEGCGAADPDDSDGEVAQTFNQTGAPPREVRLTELDHLVLNSIINTSNEVVGSPKAEQTDKIVDELAMLNANRPQSFFHRGFADAMFGRKPSRVIGPEADRWYWAGVMRGRAYLSDCDGIVEYYDNNPIVRSLGDGMDAASDEAVVHVVHALRKASRHAETADFVKAPALRDPDGELFGVLLDIGTELLRGARHGEARVVFDLLMNAEDMLRKLGFPADHDRFLTVRRRQAHTLRKLHEHEQAEKLLQDMLDMNPDPEIRAMICADLGLLKGGFAELEEVCLPLEQDALADFIERLQAGQEMFRDAIRDDVHYSGHGHYCLGALALAEGDYDAAVNHLARSRGLFNSRKPSYGATLAVRADLYDGIARAARAESAGDLTYAERIIRDAVSSGTPIPAYLIRPVAEGFELLESAEVQSRFCAAVLESDQSAALDVFADLDDALSTRPVTQGLRRRAKKLRKTEDAAAYLRKCFQGCMKARRHEDARTALDELEVLAKGGVGEAAFHDLLAEPQGLQPAWDRDEVVVAQIRCLEARGELENAMAKATPLFHEALSSGNTDEARGIYDNMRSYGLEDSLYQEVKSRLDGVVSQYESTAPKQAGDTPRKRTRPVRVLFVGGNENQQKSEPAVRTQLKERAPHVDVRFIFTGWSGNWSPHLKKVKSELDGHDVLVLMRFMRTNLGREIRKACDGKPWRTCWPSGVDGMTNSIISAAESV